MDPGSVATDAFASHPTLALNHPEQVAQGRKHEHAATANPERSLARRVDPAELLACAPSEGGDDRGPLLLGPITLALGERLPLAGFGDRAPPLLHPHLRLLQPSESIGSLCPR